MDRAEVQEVLVRAVAVEAREVGDLHRDALEGVEVGEAGVCLDKGHGRGVVELRRAELRHGRGVVRARLVDGPEQHVGEGASLDALEVRVQLHENGVRARVLHTQHTFRESYQKVPDLGEEEAQDKAAHRGLANVVCHAVVGMRGL